jgi:hypothetical protein
MAHWDKNYFITELTEHIQEGAWTPKFTTDEGRRVISMNQDVLPGAFYMDVTWFLPGKWTETKGEEGTVKEHTHDFPEAIGYVGSNPDDPYDLGAEIEFWIDGKQNIIDRSFVAFIPAGVKHCPLTIRRIDRPIFHFTAGMSQEYQ